MSKLMISQALLWAAAILVSAISRAIVGG